MTIDEHKQGPVKLYRCTNCDARWLFWPKNIDTPFTVWNLLDKYQEPSVCCDNAPMGDQIEFLRDLLPPMLRPKHAPAPAGETREDSLGLSIDMLDADRLRQWASNLDTHGADISHWASVPFVAGKLRAMADGVEQAVRDIQQLRHPEPVAKTCKCGVPADVSHYCSALDGCWVGRRLTAPVGETPATEPPTWQPMETAERLSVLDGGKPILIAWWVMGEWCAVVAHWNPVLYGWTTDNVRKIDYATHWTHIPAPPKSLGETPAEPTKD